MDFPYHIEAIQPENGWKKIGIEYRLMENGRTIGLYFREDDARRTMAAMNHVAAIRTLQATDAAVRERW